VTSPLFTGGARLSVYRLMDDRALAVAVADLEQKIEQLGYARGPVAGNVRASYEDALHQARAELHRRAAI